MPKPRRRTRGARPGMPRALPPVVRSSSRPASTALEGARGAAARRRATRVGTTSAWRPHSMSAPIRSSRATRRSSSRRRISGCAKSSKLRSASALDLARYPECSTQRGGALRGLRRTRASASSCSKRTESTWSRSIRSTYPGDLVSTISGPRSFREPAMPFWSDVVAVRGASAPHRSSTRRSVGTTCPARRSSAARSARCRGPPSGKDRRRQRPRAGRAA